MEQVEQALQVLWTTADAGQRKAADEWLRQFQTTTEAWQVGHALLKGGTSEDKKLFGATLLCTKLRGGACGGLARDAAESLRTEVATVASMLYAGKLRSQCLRAVALLLAGIAGESEVIACALSDVGRVGLAIDATLELLSLIPETGAWLTPSETESTQLLLLELLDHACSPATSAFPQSLPSSIAPGVTSAAYRIAVLECAVEWAALPSSEGLTLGVLAEAPVRVPRVPSCAPSCVSMPSCAIMRPHAPRSLVRPHARRTLVRHRAPSSPARRISPYPPYPSTPVPPAVSARQPIVATHHAAQA